MEQTLQANAIDLRTLIDQFALEEGEDDRFFYEWDWSGGCRVKYLSMQLLIQSGCCTNSGDQMTHSGILKCISQ